MKVQFDTSIPIKFDLIEEIEEQRYIRGKIWICHTGENLNGTIFTKEVIEAAIPSLSNIPVLAFIEKKNNNENDFAGHEDRLVVDDNGIRIEYLGRMYGVVPEVSHNAKFESKICEDGIEREFLTAEVIIHNKFPECIEILKREGVHSHSMEIHPESVKGKFNKQKKFEFTEFKFEGLCLLGEDVRPGMMGSKIELFTQFNYKDELNAFVNEFRQNKQEGGKELDEKLELLAKYTQIEESVLTEIKNEIDKYSIDELQNKLEEIVKTLEPEVTYALTAKQLAEQIRSELSAFRHIDRWGDSCHQYWYIDHDDQRVYAEDGQNGYLPVGINYVLSGDKVVIDITSKKRIKWVPQDLEDGTETVSTNFVSVERSTYENEKMESIQSGLKNEIFNLNEYKLQTEREEKLTMISKFSGLVEEDVATLKESVDKYSKKDLENQLFIILGKKGFSQFEQNSNKTKHIKTMTDYSLINGQPERPAYLAAVDEHINRNKK